MAKTLRQKANPASIPGLQMTPDMMTSAYETEVIEFIDSLEMEPVTQPETGPRVIRAFGWGYEPKNYDLVPVDPLPPELEPLKLAAAEFADIEPEQLEHCMVSRFEPGSMIPWLLMRPIWNRLVGVTLGSLTPLSFRKVSAKGEDPKEISLPPRSMYLLAGESRYDYEHCFPSVDETRWCLWFRDFSEEGKKITGELR